MTKQEGQGQQQIPFGDDNKKGNDNRNGNDDPIRNGNGDRNGYDYGYGCGLRLGRRSR